jgi:hypothetical protein
MTTQQTRALRLADELDAYHTAPHHKEAAAELRWLEADRPDEYFEFRIVEAPVTGETILELTDFCDANEIKDQKRYWETQIQKLQKETGG